MNLPSGSRDVGDGDKDGMGANVDVRIRIRLGSLDIFSELVEVTFGGGGSSW